MNLFSACYEHGHLDEISQIDLHTRPTYESCNQEIEHGVLPIPRSWNLPREAAIPPLGVMCGAWKEALFLGGD